MLETETEELSSSPFLFFSQFVIAVVWGLHKFCPERVFWVWTCSIMNSHKLDRGFVRLPLVFYTLWCFERQIEIATDRAFTATSSGECRPHTFAKQDRYFFDLNFFEALLFCLACYPCL